MLWIKLQTKIKFIINSNKNLGSVAVDTQDVTNNKAYFVY